MGASEVGASRSQVACPYGPSALLRHVLALSLYLVLSACTHLHSPTREAQGRDAQQKWQATDVNEVIRVERERYSALLDEEVARVKAAKLLSRDLLLGSVVAGSSLKKNLVDPVLADAKSVAGDEKVYNDFKDAQRKQALFEGKMAERMLELRRLQLKPISCEDVKDVAAVTELANKLSASAGSPARIKVILSRAKRLCDDDGANSEAVRKFVENAAVTDGVKPSQQLQEMADLYALEDKLKKDREKNRDAVKEYEAAAKEYRDAAGLPPKQAQAAAAPASAASGTSAGLQEARLKAALERLKKAVAKLKTLDDKLSLQLVSEERIEAIDQFLGALLQPKAAGTGGEKDADRAGRALQRIAASLDGWEAAQGKAKETLLVPLQMQQTIEQQRLEAINRSNVADAAVLQIHKLRVDIVNRQAKHLADARASLVWVPDTLNESMRAFMSEASGAKPTDELLERRAKVMEAAAHYGYAKGELQGELDATTLRLAALQTSASLDVSESNLRQWNTLIGGNVDLLQAWGATGIKDDLVSKGINALLLLWIGSGVN